MSFQSILIDGLGLFYGFMLLKFGTILSFLIAKLIGSITRIRILSPILSGMFMVFVFFYTGKFMFSSNKQFHDLIEKKFSEKSNNKQ